MRSFLFVPGDSPRKLDKARRCGADALIVDLEDSVAPTAKGAARLAALAFLREQRPEANRPRLYVRVNGLASGLCEGDLDAILPGIPDGIMLPKASGGADIALLDSRLSVREALHGILDGATAILALGTESPAALFGLGTYAGASQRLAGLAWGAEDLAAELGRAEARVGGGWTEPFRLARNLCLFAAAAAAVPAIDAVHADVRDAESLTRECREAARDGFAGKLAIHPAQVPVINAAFTPDADRIAYAERIIAAFAAAGGAGVTTLDGRMIDQPHLKAAERLLARAGRVRPPEPPASGS